MGGRRFAKPPATLSALGQYQRAAGGFVRPQRALVGKAHPMRAGALQNLRPPAGHDRPQSPGTREPESPRGPQASEPKGCRPLVALRPFCFRALELSGPRAHRLSGLKAPGLSGSRALGLAGLRATDWSREGPTKRPKHARSSVPNWFPYPISPDTKTLMPRRWPKLCLAMGGRRFAKPPAT